MKNKLFLLMAIVILWSQPAWAGTAVTVSDKIFDAPCRALGIPKPLLMAIAKVESNFRPWTLNIEGQSFYFASREEALFKAREARKAGDPSTPASCRSMTGGFGNIAFPWKPPSTRLPTYI